MKATDDGSNLKVLNPGHTAQGPPKSWATPLSPSITDEVSSNENHAIPSTANDELFAWLLQKKVDDASIGQYLYAREITLAELEEFDDAELELLIKDIEKEIENTIQMIDKSRFLRACRSLRKVAPKLNQPPFPNGIHHSNLHQGQMAMHQNQGHLQSQNMNQMQPLLSPMSNSPSPSQNQLNPYRHDGLQSQHNHTQHPGSRPPPFYQGMNGSNVNPSNFPPPPRNNNGYNSYRHQSPFPSPPRSHQHGMNTLNGQHPQQSQQFNQGMNGQPFLGRYNNPNHGNHGNPGGNNNGFSVQSRVYPSQSNHNGHNHNHSHNEHQSRPPPNMSTNKQLPYIIKPGSNKKNKPRTMTYNGPSHPVSNQSHNAPSYSGHSNHRFNGLLSDGNATGNYPPNGPNSNRSNQQHKVSVAESAAQIAMSYMDGQRTVPQAVAPNAQSLTLSVNAHRHSKRNLNGYDEEMEDVERSEEKKSMDLQSALQADHESSAQITDHHHLNHSSFTAVSQDTIVYHGASNRRGPSNGGSGGRQSNHSNAEQSSSNLQIQGNMMLSSQHSNSHSHNTSRQSNNSRSRSTYRHPPPTRDHKSGSGSSNSHRINPGYSAQISVISPSAEKEEADYDDEEENEMQKARKYENGGNGGNGSGGGNGGMQRDGQSMHQKEEEDEDGLDVDDGNGGNGGNGNGNGNGDEDEVGGRESRAISVMTDIPQNQHETIYLQLTRFTKKSDLKDELYSVIKRLRAEIKSHQTRIESFTTTQSKLKSKHSKQMEQWKKWYIVELQYLGNEYFGALFQFLSTQISIEWTYIECFNEKLKRLTAAHNTVWEHLEQWDMATLQDFVKETIVGVTRMKVSSATIQKKRALEAVKTQIGNLQREYEAAKQLLATPQVDHGVRQQAISIFFSNVTTDYSEQHNNLMLSTTFFCEEHLQDKFNSFILDERCQVHRQLVKSWLSTMRRQHERDKVSIKAVYQFMEQLIIKFSKMYSVDKVSPSYYYYVERFTYICILSIPSIDEALSALLQTPRGKREHDKLAAKHQYALFCKLLHAKYMVNVGGDANAAASSSSIPQNR